MDPVTGVVDFVRFRPGERDVELFIDGNLRSVHLLTNDPDASVTVDGFSCISRDIIHWLAIHPCRVTIYPLADRYGAALKAEFMEIPKEPE